MAVYEEMESVPLSERAGVLVNLAGAALSLGLMIGIGIWGYKLVMRDVTGIPVVRAMQGEMRVAPENPGGEVSAHAGLAVNEVVAEGEAAGFGDTLVLAPQTPGLATEDIAVQPTAEAEEIVPAEVTDPLGTVVEEVVVQATAEEPEAAPDPNAPLSAEAILALADQIAAEATPLSELAPGEDIAPTITLNGEVVEQTPQPATAPQAQVIPASVPGVSISLRPVLRPTAVRAAPVAAAAPVSPAEPTVSTTPIAAGTKLVQLGAFPTPDVAAAEWGRLATRFEDYMSGKDRLIQAATSGGQTFYRLRALGFEELADARRFCAALDAGGAPCIPLVAR